MTSISYNIFILIITVLDISFDNAIFLIFFHSGF